MCRGQMTWHRAIQMSEKCKEGIAGGPMASDSMIKWMTQDNSSRPQAQAQGLRPQCRVPAEGMILVNLW